jgi:hypothetical protein
VGLQLAGEVDVHGILRLRWVGVLAPTVGPGYDSPGRRGVGPAT